MGGWSTLAAVVVGSSYRSSLCIYYGNDDGAHAGGVSTAHGEARASSNGAGLERCSSWWPVLGSSGSMARSDGRGVEHERRGHVKELRPAEGAEHLTKSKKRGVGEGRWRIEIKHRLSSIRLRLSVS